MAKHDRALKLRMAEYRGLMTKIEQAVQAGDYKTATDTCSNLISKQEQFYRELWRWYKDEQAGK